MLRFVIRILGNALAISLASFFVKNFSSPTSWKFLLLAGFILAIFNAVLKPLLKLVSMPLIILSLGLFSLVINIALLWLLTLFLPDLKIVGFWAYFWGTLIISLINILIGLLTKKSSKKE